MLTKKQRDLLLLIHERMMKGDVAPSFEEMRDLLGLKSKSGIHRLITGLVERGYLARLPHRARALEVRKLPEGYLPPANDQSAAATLTRNNVRQSRIAARLLGFFTPKFHNSMITTFGQFHITETRIRQDFRDFHQG